MQPFAVFSEPVCDPVIGVEWLNELQVGVAEVEIGQPHTEADGLVDDDDFQAEAVPEVAERDLGVGDNNGDVIEAPDHGAPTSRNAWSFEATTRSTAAICASWRALNRLPVRTPGR